MTGSVPAPVSVGVAARSVSVSGPSKTVSSVVGTRTRKLVTPAGTEMLTAVPLVMPLSVVKVVPPSKDTSICCAVSVAMLPLPSLSVSVMLVAVVEALLSVTVKSSGEPSAATALLMASTWGRSSSGAGGGSVGVGSTMVPVPSSLMVAEPEPSRMTALVGLESSTEKDSGPS